MQSEKSFLKRLLGQEMVSVLLTLPFLVVGFGGFQGASNVVNERIVTESELVKSVEHSSESHAAIRAAMRSARRVDGSTALVLHDTAEQILVTVDGLFTLVEGRDGATVKFGDVSLGRNGGMVALSEGVPRGDGATVRLERAAGSIDVEEWWRNGDLGVEQGFTVRSRPEGGGRLHLRQTITSALTAKIVDSGRGVAFFDSERERLRFEGLVAFDALGRDLPAKMRLASNSLTFEVDDTNAVFPVVIDPVWSQQSYLKASNADADDAFGWSVAISGDTVVVGAPFEKSNATGVNGDGSNNSATGSGAVYVFARSGAVWSQQAYLKASNSAVGDRFGSSVAISGDTIVVGAPLEDSNATGVNGDGTDNSSTSAGAVYVFTRSGAVWSQQAYLKASNTDTEDAFGSSVAVSGDTVVVGAPFEDSNASGVNGDSSNNSVTDSGAVYVFTRSGVVWSQQAYLKASNTELADRFGHSVSVSGDTIVVGAYFEDSNATGVNGDGSDNSASGSGAVYVFARSGAVWSQQAYLKASNSGLGDRFGYSVSISGDTIAVGAPLEDSNATGVNGDGTDNSSTNAGAVYVFTRSGAVWSQQAYLKASNTDDFDEFGNAVAISTDTIAVGAPVESSNATGVDGDETDNSSTDAGAVYVFSRSGAVWSQQAYLKASNTDSYDSLGLVVSTSDDTVVSGAYYEDGSASVVNGADDNAASDAGAAYAWLMTPPSSTTTTSTTSTTSTVVATSTSSVPASTATAPETTTSTVAVVGDSQSAPEPPRTLPSTGRSWFTVAPLAVLLITLGSVVYLAQRRRRHIDLG